MAKTKSATGVWLDKDTGAVVYSAPHHGKVLVAPGHDVTDAEQAIIDRYEADHATFAGEQASVAPAEKPAPAKAAAKK